MEVCIPFNSTLAFSERQGQITRRIYYSLTTQTVRKTSSTIRYGHITITASSTRTVVN